MKLQGARILSEANDLKRTLGALADDLGMEKEHLQTVVDGEARYEEVLEVIERMKKTYPIDSSDLLLLEDDCHDGVRIMRADESESSSRIFNRRDRNGALGNPYYEYRDTAMSRNAPFKPEWIEELRVVEDADPDNPDVVYNNGHFMHQTTFFIGPVNFYWEVNGQRFCSEMNTGDSNYITPFWRHSFTSRDASQTALILAITFGGDVRRAQKEMYSYGERIGKYIVDSRDRRAGISQLIRLHMDNENLSLENIETLSREHGVDLDFQRLLDPETEKSGGDLASLAILLNISPADLTLPEYRYEDEVVVTHRETSESYYFPGNDNRQYRIHQLARTCKMSMMKSFDIAVLGEENDLDSGFSSSLHSYVYNYGDSDIGMEWSNGTSSHREIIRSGDSLYIQPFIRHAFSRLTEAGQLYCARVSGAINMSTIKELSGFSDTNRVNRETTCWFD